MKRMIGILLSMLYAMGVVAGEATHDRVSLSASASAEVANDTLEAVVFVEEQGRDTARLAREVNRTMQRVLAIARQAHGVDARSEDYETEAVYEKNRIRAWRVRQSLRLKSRDFDALGALVGRLQQWVKVRGMRFSVSDQARAKAENGLIQRAIDAFRERARLIARSFGRSGYRLIEAQVNDRGGYQPPLPRARMALAEATPAPPALAAGTRRLTVSVSGTVELEPAP